MTGEVTLRGRVLPIGGLKEKLLAAHRGALKTVLIPRDNERELSEIPDNIKKDLTIIPVATVDEVLKNALVSELTPIEWDERADLEAAVAERRRGRRCWRRSDPLEDAGGGHQPHEPTEKCPFRGLIGSVLTIDEPNDRELNFCREAQVGFMLLAFRDSPS